VSFPKNLLASVSIDDSDSLLGELSGYNAPSSIYVAQIRHLKIFSNCFIRSGSASFPGNTDGHFCLMSTLEHSARLDCDSSTTHRELAVKSDPLVAVSETDLLVCVVPCEPSLLGHPVAPEDELVQIGRCVYLMPYATFVYRERNVVGVI